MHNVTDYSSRFQRDGPVFQLFVPVSHKKASGRQIVPIAKLGKLIYFIFLILFYIFKFLYSVFAKLSNSLTFLINKKNENCGLFVVLKFSTNTKKKFLFLWNLQTTGKNNPFSFRVGMKRYE